MRSRPDVARPRAMLALAAILAGCSQILGLSEGTDQGACETDPQCAPGFECRESLCRSPCSSPNDCELASAGKGGGDGDGDGGVNAGGSAGTMSTSGDAGTPSVGGLGAGGATPETAGAAGEGQGGTSVAGAGGIVGNLPIAGIGGGLFTQARRAE